MFNFIKNLFLTKEFVEFMSVKDEDFNYLVNDPTTPDLRVPVKYPDKNRLSFLVNGHVSNPKTEQQQRAANVYITIGQFVNYFQERAKTPVRRWAATNQLSVVPVAGKMLNAYYDRKSLKFFFELNPSNMKVVYTADSTDIVAHELGHALLDAMRPDFWSIQALEIWSFHEAFADISAIMSIMQYDVILERALAETNGDLRKSNVFSRLAEEVGDAVYQLTRGKGGYLPGALRDATIAFHYVNPGTLPKEAPQDKLAAECHSFGRVFLSAWYEIMVRIYESNLADGSAPLEALKNAKEVAFRIFLEAVPVTPRVPRYFEAAAKSMITIAKNKGEVYESICRKVFKDWNITTDKVKMLSNKTWDDVRNNLKETDEIMTQGNTIIVRCTNNKIVKLSDYAQDGEVYSLSVGEYNLADLEVELATDSYFKFENGQLVDEITHDEQEALNDARLCALVIQSQNQIGPDEDFMWTVEDGKLARNFIA